MYRVGKEGKYLTLNERVSKTYQTAIEQVAISLLRGDYAVSEYSETLTSNTYPEIELSICVDGAEVNLVFEDRGL